MKNLFAFACSLSFLMILPALSAQPYYADVVFDISETGTVMVSGISNHEMLSEGSYHIYTSKEGAYWLLNVTFPGYFSDYVYEARMPPGGEINYINTSGRISIKQSDGRIILQGFGSGGFSLMVQYTLNPPDYPGYLWLLLFPVAGIVIVFLYRKMPGKKTRDYSPEMLTERQLSIVRLLEKKGRPMTQKQIEDALDIPKSSLSRNISTLEKAGVLVKKGRGMSNYVWFSERDE